MFEWVDQMFKLNDLENKIDFTKGMLNFDRTKLNSEVNKFEQ